MRWDNDDIVSHKLSQLAFNLTGISKESHDKKISAANYDLGDEVSRVKREVADEIWTEYNEVSTALVNEVAEAVDLLFKQTKK